MSRQVLLVSCSAFNQILIVCDWMRSFVIWDPQVSQPLPLQSAHMFSCNQSLMNVTGLADYMSSYESVEYTSRPIATTGNGQEPSLLQVLQQILPHCFQHAAHEKAQSKTQAPLAEQDEKEDSSATADVPAEANTDALPSSEQGFIEQYDVLVAGIKPSIRTPLAWLHATLHAPDMFLYVTVIALQ